MVTHLRSINPAWHTVISQMCTKLHRSLAWRQRHTHSNNYVHECSVTGWWLTVEPMICMLIWNQWCHTKVIYARMIHCYNCLKVHKSPSGSKYHTHMLLLFIVTSKIRTVRAHGSTGTRFLIPKILVKLKQGQNTNACTNTCGLGEICDFQQITRNILEMIQNRCTVSVKGKDE